MDIAERRIPQDGRFRVRYKGRQIDFRVSIMPTVFGEDAVLRILDKQSMSEKFKRLSLEVVGFGDEDKARFARYIREPYGMVLVTGPTGSGKTTTLYAALSEIQSDEDKIVTIEDPVEYQLHGITQIPINEKKGLTFARGLRSILRHDPDKIMVGEIRDPETAQIAIQSALTGHLVFTTVHANNVVDVLGRFLNMGVEAYNFVSALNCILAQRLVRVICTHCRVGRRYSAERLAASSLDPAEWSAFDFSEGEGCIECSGTGYHGRTAIHELLDMSDHIRELILTKRPSSEIAKAARRRGHANAARIGCRARTAGDHDAPRDRQGHIHRLTMARLLQALDRLLPDPPPPLVFEIGWNSVQGALREGDQVLKHADHPWPAPLHVADTEPGADTLAGALDELLRELGPAPSPCAAVLLPDADTRLAVFEFDKPPRRAKDLRNAGRGTVPPGPPIRCAGRTHRMPGPARFPARAGAGCGSLRAGSPPLRGGLRNRRARSGLRGTGHRRRAQSRFRSGDDAGHQGKRPNADHGSRGVPRASSGRSPCPTISAATFARRCGKFSPTCSRRSSMSRSTSEALYPDCWPAGSRVRSKPRSRSCPAKPAAESNP